MKLKTRWVFAALLTLTLACAKNATTKPADAVGEPTISSEQIRAIAEDAYVYAFPMMESYRTMYVQAVDRLSSGYKAPFNELVHETMLLGPEFAEIVRPNNDTMYSFAWLDLRGQPIVITVPRIDDRYYSVQLVDMFTHNFAYIGRRETGVEAGSFVVAGPDWTGTKPDRAKAVFRSESQFVYCIIRTEVRGPEDVAAVRRLQRSYELSPLHAFLGRSYAPEASGITFPSYDPGKARSSGFIDLFNFLLSQVSAPSERELMERFSAIGIRPGATSASLGLEPSTRNAIDAGVQRGIIAVTEAAENPGRLEGVRTRAAGGWRGVDGMFGDRSAMRGKYLVRAVAAKLGLYGNDTVEAYYPIANTDDTGEPLDGATQEYVVRFERDDMPPVDAFWSITMYGLPDQLMVENPIDRYSIGDRSNMSYAEDGSLTIHIQHRSPGEAREANWLPAPDGPFSLQLRMYLPKDEALSPLYLPPPVRARN